MDAEFEDVELAKQVQGYQRRTESGELEEYGVDEGFSYL